MAEMLLAFYGDDFSGSTDVLEVLALAGLRAVLLPRPPGPDVLERYPGVQAVGVAGVSRSLPPAAMEAELAPAFAALRQLPARRVHYKVCSTFDSSPEVGSIGKAIELGRAAFASPCVPVLAGAPALGRYCAFGNLFARAAAGGAVHRLDRHPTMSRHPVTPMREADLTRHLAAQMQGRIALLDILQVRGAAAEHFRRLRVEGAEAVLLDVLDDGDLPALGRLLWEEAGRFVVGSSGVEYALTAYWREAGLLPEPPPPPPFGPADRVLAVSGSCSPVTAGQIAHAVDAGFAEVALAPSEWAAPDGPALGSAVNRTLALLREGRSVVAHAARGPDDARIPEARALLAGREGQRDGALGGALAALVRAAVEQAGVRRVAVAGGDTAGYTTRALGVEALSFVAPLAPGSPLCCCHGRPGLDGLEVTFKGGQVGGPDFFVRALRGTS